MSWWKTAKPGDFVVAVISTGKMTNRAASLVKGKVYAIKEIFVAPPDDPRAGVVAISLMDHNNGVGRTRKEAGYPVSFFRPVKPLSASLIDCLSAPVSPRGISTEERV